MNTKQLAVFFVALLSFDYTTATFFGKNGYYGWSRGCRCKKDLTSRLDDAFENTKLSFSRKYKNGCPLRDTNTEEYALTGGKFQFDKLERTGPYRCSLSQNYVRVFFKIGFFNLLVNYYVSLIEDILDDFLGGVFSFVGKIFGHITNFLFRIAISELYCTVVLIQNFSGNGRFQIEGLYLDEIQNLSFRNKDFKKHESSLVSYFNSPLDHVFRYALHYNFGTIFEKHVTQIEAQKSWFYYEESGRSSSGGYDGNESDENDGGYSGKKSRSDNEKSGSNENGEGYDSGKGSRGGNKKSKSGENEAGYDSGKGSRDGDEENGFDGGYFSEKESRGDYEESGSD